MDATAVSRCPPRSPRVEWSDGARRDSPEAVSKGSGADGRLGGKGCRRRQILGAARVGGCQTVRTRCKGRGVLTTRDSEGAVWDGDLLGHDGRREGGRTWVSGGKR